MLLILVLVYLVSEVLLKASSVFDHCLSLSDCPLFVVVYFLVSCLCVVLSFHLSSCVFLEHLQPQPDISCI